MHANGQLTSELNKVKQKWFENDNKNDFYKKEENQATWFWKTTSNKIPYRRTYFSLVGYLLLGFSEMTRSFFSYFIISNMVKFMLVWKLQFLVFFVETADRVYPPSKLNIKLFVHKGWWCFFFSKDGGVGYPRGLERTASKGWEKRHKGK